jgi:ribonuclease M5
MRTIKQAIVVEGRYDKSAISRYIDTVVIETGGFRILRDSEKIELLRRIALKRGLVILTDSDAAGFLIRGKLKSMLPGSALKHAYIPDIYGKERRKRVRSREGKLGVEAMDEETVIAALQRAGATFEDIESTVTGGITRADMYEDGLLGGEYASRRRRALEKAMALPEHLSSSALLDVINALYSPEEYKNLVKNLET